MSILSERLRPSTIKEGNAELLACMILVAPSGMATEDRDAWLRAARQTLSGIPADLLKQGAEKARKTCQFLSQIVPAIMAETDAEWTRRKRALAEEQRYVTDVATQCLPAPELCDPQEAADIVAELTAKLSA